MGAAIALGDRARAGARAGAELTGVSQLFVCIVGTAGSVQCFSETRLQPLSPPALPHKQPQ